jgi:hypothetical protein
VLFQHLAPGGGVGEAVGEAELGLQEFVDAADDVGDDGLRGVEDAALDLELLVVGAEEQLVEVDDRVFAARRLPKSRRTASMCVSGREQVDDIGTMPSSSKSI